MKTNSKVKVRLLYALIIFGALACDTTSSIDPPDESFFVKFYGGEGDQEGIDAVLNTDGTITLFGTTDSLKASNVVKQLYLVNIEQNGRIVWETTIPTASNAEAKDIELTNDGRLVIVGDLEDSQGLSDIILMTLTLDGTEINRTIFGLDTLGQNTDETSSSVTQTNDGFIISGSTSKIVVKAESGGANDIRDALHLRYFDNLTQYPSSWRIGHGPGIFDSGIKTIQVSQNEFYFFAYSKPSIPVSSSDFRYYLIGLGADGETNTSGDLAPDIAGSDEILSSVIISPPQSGEGYLLTGISNTPGVGSDIFIVKLRKDLTFDISVDRQFEKNLNISLGAVNNTRISTFASTNSGFFILANEKTGSSQNFYLTKIDNGGFEVWSNPIIFGGELDDEIGAVLEMPDGSIGIIGTFAVGDDGEKKMTFIKVNKEGNFAK